MSEATYAVHLRLIGKPGVDFPVINELFTLDVTAEALRMIGNRRF